jgi:hypothetical protein
MLKNYSCQIIEVAIKTPAVKLMFDGGFKLLGKWMGYLINEAVVFIPTAGRVCSHGLRR